MGAYTQMKRMQGCAAVSGPLQELEKMKQAKPADVHLNTFQLPTGPWHTSRCIEIPNIAGRVVEAGFAKSVYRL